MLHASVLVYFRRQRSSQWARHVVVPLAGAAIMAYVLWNMARNAQLVGLAWMAIGGASWLLAGRRAAVRA
jgi:hypothetical protein